jgi:hypothetical protein
MTEENNRGETENLQAQLQRVTHLLSSYKLMADFVQIQEMPSHELAESPTFCY